MLFGEPAPETRPFEQVKWDVYCGKNLLSNKKDGDGNRSVLSSVWTAKQAEAAGSRPGDSRPETGPILLTFLPATARFN